MPNGLAAISKANALGMEGVHGFPKFEEYISGGERVRERFSCEWLLVSKPEGASSWLGTDPGIINA